MSIRMTSEHTELTFHYMRVEGREETLLEFLLRRFRYLDDQEWRENINDRRIWIDGELGCANYKLRNNQILFIYVRISLNQKLIWTLILFLKMMH